MKHQIPEQIISTAELLPLLEKPAPLSRSERLELWAQALERHTGPLFALRRLEHPPHDGLRSYRSANTPLTVAYEEPALRAQGLAGDSLGDVMDFFELSDHHAHALLCDCHYRGSMTGASLANGLLDIQLVREVPEAMKPQQIKINAAPKPRVIENKKSQAA